MRRKLVAGNWKMNGTRASLGEVERIAARHPARQPDPGVDLLLCLPATLITAAAALLKGSTVMIGAQDCHAQASGAHTGDLGAPMLADAGASAVIVGHSERRAAHAESCDTVRAKAAAAHSAGLMAVICLGETLAQREADETLDIIAAQLAGSVPDTATGADTVIAYEPVWAIGTGLTAGTDQIGAVHAFLRTRLIERFGPRTGGAIRLLYGGSVKPDNAAEIFAVGDVDGALVGGASLRQADFSPIVTALEESV